MKLTRTKRRYGCEINITPLIDIVFLLIIFSMVVSQFTRLQAAKVDLPLARRGRTPATAPAGRLVVNVTDDGRVIISGRVRDEAAVEAVLAGRVARAAPGGVSVLVRGDRRTQWARIARILRACAAQGIEDVEVAVLPPGEPPSPREP